MSGRDAPGPGRDADRGGAAPDRRVAEVGRRAVVGRGAAVVAHTPRSLADHLTRLALAHRLALETGDPDRPPPALRMGFDGPVPADGAGLADAVCAELARRAVPVARVRGDHFLHARSIRFEHGDDPRAYTHRWYDAATLRREVLDPLGPGGSMRWLPRLRDPVSDRPFRDAALLAVPGTVAVLDAAFLAGRELAEAVDLRVHLEVSPAAQARRLPAELRARVLAAWRDYLEEFDPAGSAAVVVRHERPAHPAVSAAVGG